MEDEVLIHFYWVLSDVLTKLQNDLDEDIFINIKIVKAPGPATQ